MSNETLTFEVQYTVWDYLHAVIIKLNLVKNLLKSNNERFAYWVISILKPLIIFFLVAKASLTKLKHLYSFELNQKFSRKFNSTSDSVNWSKFCSYTETEKAILLNLDKSQGNDGQILIPKRVLSSEQLELLFKILKSNQIFAGEIDLNVDSLNH